MHELMHTCEECVCVYILPHSLDLFFLIYSMVSNCIERLNTRTHEKMKSVFYAMCVNLYHVKFD